MPRLNWKFHTQTQISIMSLSCCSCRYAFYTKLTLSQQLLTRNPTHASQYSTSNTANPANEDRRYDMIVNPTLKWGNQTNKTTSQQTKMEDHRQKTRKPSLRKLKNRLKLSTKLRKRFPVFVIFATPLDKVIPIIAVFNTIKIGGRQPF